MMTYKKAQKSTSRRGHVQTKTAKVGQKSLDLQTKRDRSDQEMPAYSPLPESWVTDNPLVNEGGGASHQDPQSVQRQVDSGATAPTPLATPAETIQRLCAECEAELSGDEEKREKPQIQTKLTVGAPGDQYEVEADTMAARVMSMAEPIHQSPIQRAAVAEDDTPAAEVQTKPLAAAITPLVQRTSADDSPENVQAKASSAGSFETSQTVESQLSASKGGGSPLADEVRGFMEPRFGADFSQVRVHTDSTAVQMSRDLGAQAFTHGSDVYFGAGTSPGTNELTAHELTHVIQQTGAIQSKPLDGVIQRDGTVTLDPVIVVGTGSKSPKDKKKADQSEKDKQKISDEAMKRLPGVGTQFLDEWFSAASAGVNSVPEPEDPGASAYWWIALAGNMTWAATSLMAPEMAVAIRAASFIGAAVGSGVVQKANQVSVPAGKPIIVTNLAKARDSMKGKLRPAISDTAAECALENITDSEQQDERLWKKLFPGVSTKNQFEAIVSASIQSAQTALADFMTQFKAWKATVDECAHQKALHPGGGTQTAMNEPSPDEPTSVQTKLVPDIQGFFFPMIAVAPTEEQMAACQLENPFNPKLTF